jgi:hypothetical protein
MIGYKVTTVGECRCGHRRELHDSIALRYCAATQSQQLTRGCICTPAGKSSRR